MVVKSILYSFVILWFNMAIVLNVFKLALVVVFIFSSTNVFGQFSNEFTSTPVTDAQVNVAYTYNVTTEALFDADREIYLEDDVVLPQGLSFIDNGDGTALLSGTPAEAGDFDIEIVMDPDIGSNLSQSFTLTIEKGDAVISFSDLVVTYNGSPQTPTVTTNPGGLSVNITFDGSPAAPENAGTYEVTATVDDPDYQGSKTETFEIEKASATISFSGLSQVYNGNPRPVTVTTSPAGLSVIVTYDGDTEAPVNAGSYTVEASISEANYKGISTNTLSISKAEATITLGNLLVVYDGGPKPVSVMTSPSGLNYEVTYDGDTQAPSEVGEYEVVATIADEPNYTGQSEGILTIENDVAEINLGNLNVIYNGNPQSVTVTTIPEGLDVVVTYDGEAAPPTDVGTYEVVAIIEEDAYEGSRTATMTIAKAEATIDISNLSVTYDGSPKEVNVTTEPEGLTVNVTYEGGTEPPVNAGSYDVVATVVDDSYQGLEEGILVIAKAEAELVLSDLETVYDGEPKPVTVDTDPPGLEVGITYDGESSPPVNAGSYAVQATIDNANYSGSMSGALVISKAEADIEFTGLSAIFDGDPKPVSVTTAPAGLAVDVTYDGEENAPSAVGSYTVAATISDLNYQGSSTATLVISNGVAEITLSGLNAVYDGEPKEVTATTEPDGLNVEITYDGSQDPPVDAGSYSVNAFVNDINYGGSVTATLTIEKQTAAVTLTDLTAVFDGSPKSVTVTTSPANLAVEVTYDGSPVEPTGPGTYQVIAIIQEQNYQGEANGTFTITNDADGNRRPVLTNLESTPLIYSQGAAPVHITETLIVNDFDDLEMASATISISQNYINGEDILSYSGNNTDISIDFDEVQGRLLLTGMATRAAYEAAISDVTYNNRRIGETNDTHKEISIVVSDSLLESDPVFRPIEIVVYPDIEPVNAFTPNGDQVNDYWDFKNLEKYTNVSISVYSQGGTEVFHCSSADCQWDGTYQGKSLPAGVYIYMIDLDQGKREYKGTVSILK